MGSFDRLRPGAAPRGIVGENQASVRQSPSIPA